MLIDSIQSSEQKSELTFSVVAENQKNCLGSVGKVYCELSTAVKIVCCCLPC